MADFPTTSPVGRTDAIARAFRTNAEIGRTSDMSEPSTINPGPATTQGPRTFMHQTDTMGEKLSRYYYELGVKAAQQAFVSVKAPQPTAPKPQTAAQVGASKAQSQQLSAVPPSLPSLPKPQVAFKPPALQMPPSPVTATQQMMTARQTDVAQTGVGKAAGFNIGLTAPPKTRPGEIDPNNKDIVLGTNFEEPWHPDKRIGAVFDSFRSQKNHDVLNAGNEATLGTPEI